MAIHMKSNSGFYIPGSPSPADEWIMNGLIFNPPTAINQDFLASLATDPTRLATLEADLGLAYYRRQTDELTLIRDACGQTPLFYAYHENGWAFSFNLPDLFDIIDGPPDLNEETFYDFTATHYRYVFRDPSRTFHQGIYQVPAGSYVSFKNNKAVVKRWFNLNFQPDASSMSFEEASQRYVSLLDDNVQLRLKALKDESIGFTVSSGMDSSTVACLAAPHLPAPLSTWFVAYREQSGSPYDESEGVNNLIKATGFSLNRLDLTAPDLIGETSQLMDLTGAPIITVTWLAHYVLAKQAAASGLKYLFSGLGGDESLAGEFEHFFLFFADLKASGQEDLLDKETQAWIRLHDHPVFKKSPEVRDAYFKRNLVFKTREIKVDQPRYLANRPYFNQEWVKYMEARIAPPPMPKPFPYFLSNRLYQEMNYETSPPTLWSEAMSSRAGGIRGVFPMTSPRLLSLALSLPGTFKYENGLTKMLLRRSLKGILPESSRLNSVKTGFNAPLDLWLKEPGLSKDCLDLLNSTSFRNLHWLTPGSVERIITEHRKGEANHMMLIWPLISTAIFLEKNRKH